MANEPNTPIQNVYAQRLSDDLAANRREQQAIADQLGQLTGLQDRLSQLQQEEAWLTKYVQTAIPGSPEEAAAAVTPAPAAPEADTAAPADAQAVVPQPRGSKAKKAAPRKAAKKPAAPEAKPAEAKPAEVKAAPAKKAPAKKAPAKSAATKAPATKSAATKAPATKAAAKPATAKKAPAKKPVAKKAATEERTAPPLHEVVLNLLLVTPGEPRTAREICDELQKAHPERATSVQVVRNSLELNVRKNRIEKSNQQGSVMYTGYAKGAAPAQAAPAAEKPGEQVPAEV
ncbi:hypothetical protein ABT160_34670 [Streptomyces sp. NPDC001941]|uniref:hypothetical protein n=1 Tax=Streptomyces sp. NPDC001941 TaxID=3154659 RepID=UPI003330EBCF